MILGRLSFPLDEGTKKSVVKLGKRLKEMNHDVYIYTRRPVSRDQIHGIPIIEANISPLNFVMNKKQIDELEPDIVHVHSSSPRMALYTSKLCSKSIWTIPAWRGDRLGLLLQKYLSRTSRVYTSKSLKSTVGQKGSIIPYGINTRKYSLENKPSIENRPSILFLGPPEERRGYHDAAECIKILSEEGFDPRFHVAVRDVEGHFDKAKKVIEEKNIDEYSQVKGFIEDLPEFLNTVDVLLNPIINSDGVTSPPIATLEAMSTGRICICSRTEDFENIIEDGKNGFLVNKNQPREIANKIKELSGKDLNNISKSARKTVVNNFSLKASVEDYNKLYNEVKEDGGS